MHILVTGASRGVGRAIAKAAAASGMFDKITINSRKNETALQETIKLIEKENVSDGLKLNLTLGDVSDISYIHKLRDEFGPVDVLINNAAISYTGLIIDMTPENWQESIGTNLTSIYNTCHTFLPDMIHNQSGHIINISSVWGAVGASCEVAYSATKGAVNSFTKALAKEVGPSHVQVNAISLGIMDTDMNSHLSPDDIDSICEDIPMGRMGTPEEAAEAVMNMLRMPKYYTGDILTLDGGWI